MAVEWLRLMWFKTINHWLFRKRSKYTYMVIFYKWYIQKYNTAAQVVLACQPGCEKMERKKKWRENEEMEREWGNGERTLKLGEQRTSSRWQYMAGVVVTSCNTPAPFPRIQYQSKVSKNPDTLQYFFRPLFHIRFSIAWSAAQGGGAARLSSRVTAFSKAGQKSSRTIASLKRF